MGYENRADFSVLVGKTLTSVIVAEHKDQIVFTAQNGDSWVMYHDQGCCESVMIEAVVGDLQDLIGSPILTAEEATSNENPPSQHEDSFTRTFYRIATAKGLVSIRWVFKRVLFRVG